MYEFINNVYNAAMRFPVGKRVLVFECLWETFRPGVVVAIHSNLGRVEVDLQISYMGTVFADFFRVIDIDCEQSWIDEYIPAARQFCEEVHTPAANQLREDFLRATLNLEQ
jgi:hypothetical protein